MTGSFMTRSRHHPNIATYPPAATYGPRVLRDYEFVWVLAGAAHWSTAQEELELVPGRLLLVGPGERDAYRWTEVGASRHAFVHFDVVDGSSQLTSWPRTRPLTGDNPMAALCQHLLRLGARRDPSSRHQVDRVLDLLLQLFVSDPIEGEEAAEPLPPQLQAVAEYLRMTWSAGPARAVPVAELAAAAAVSTGHLSRMFARQLGTGPAAAVELLRLARVATLLRRSNLTLASLAGEAGFSDAFHLSRRFRAAYGMPPSQYRSSPVEPDPLLPVHRAGLAALARAVRDADQDRVTAVRERVGAGAATGR